MGSLFDLRLVPALQRHGTTLRRGWPSHVLFVLMERTVHPIRGSADTRLDCNCPSITPGYATSPAAKLLPLPRYPDAAPPISPW